MINIAIGGMTVPLQQASDGWVNQMIEEARKRGIAPCIQVRIQTAGVDLALATPGCPGGGGGGRQPNELERRIFDAWSAHHLGTPQISPGEFRAFLNELARLTNSR